PLTTTSFRPTCASTVVEYTNLPVTSKIDTEAVEACGVLKIMVVDSLNGFGRFSRSSNSATGVISDLNASPTSRISPSALYASATVGSEVTLNTLLSVPLFSARNCNVNNPSPSVRRFACASDQLVVNMPSPAL